MYLKKLLEDDKNIECTSKPVKITVTNIKKPNAVNREMADIQQSIIKCCLHCGSISYKKHGRTSKGVQRYICKDCGKSFSENYGLITHYSHLENWQWYEIVNGTVNQLSLTEIAKNIKCSVSTVWACRMKIYQLLKTLFGDGDTTLSGVVEADGKYERISFKGLKNRLFFVNTLGRFPRHHMDRTKKIEYLEKCGKFKDLFRNKSNLLQVMLSESQNNLTGQMMIDKNHQEVCILTAIDRNNSIMIKPVSAGSAQSKDVYSCFHGKIEDGSVLVTDMHTSYKYLVWKDKINHIQVLSSKHKNGEHSLSRVNSLHASMKSFIGDTRAAQPATKYIDLYFVMFWWLQKNKDVSNIDKTDKLQKLISGCIEDNSRSRLQRITIKSLVDRAFPIDTKGYYGENI